MSGVGFEKITYVLLWILYTGILYPSLMLRANQKWNIQREFYDGTNYSETVTPFDNIFFFFSGMVLWGSFKFCVQLKSNDNLPHLTWFEAAQPVIAIILAHLCTVFAIQTPSSTQVVNYTQSVYNLNPWQVSPYLLLPLVIALVGKFWLKRRVDIFQLVGVVLLTAGFFLMCWQVKETAGGWWQGNYEQCLSYQQQDQEYYGYEQTCYDYQWSFSFLGLFAALASTILLSGSFLRLEELLAVKRCNALELAFIQGYTGLLFLTPLILIYAIIQWASGSEVNLIGYAEAVFNQRGAIASTIGSILVNGLIAVMMIALIQNGSALRTIAPFIGTVVMRAFGNASDLSLFAWILISVCIISVFLIQATSSCGKEHVAQVQEQYAAKEGQEQFVEMDNSAPAVDANAVN